MSSSILFWEMLTLRIFTLLKSRNYCAISIFVLLRSLRPIKTFRQKLFLWFEANVNFHRHFSPAFFLFLFSYPNFFFSHFYFPYLPERLKMSLDVLKHVPELQENYFFRIPHAHIIADYVWPGLIMSPKRVIDLNKEKFTEDDVLIASYPKSGKFALLFLYFCSFL